MLKIISGVLLVLIGPATAFAQGVGLAETSASPATQVVEPNLVPIGTVLQIRLQQTIASFGSKRDAPVHAIVIAPVEIDGKIILPLKTVLIGRVKEIRRVGIGLARETAHVKLEFDQVKLPGGQPQLLKGKIVSVDDARETVDASGRINGIRATASFSSLLSGLAISAGTLDPMMLGFALSSSLSVFRIPESEIILPVGAELRIKLEDPLLVSARFPPIAPQVVESDADKEALTDVIRPLPFRTATDPGAAPSDLTSLVYVGSQEAIARAFEAAGWVRSDKLDAKSSYGVMRAVIENQGYREAPVSTLLLDNQRPVLTYAKTLNTFFKRHHLRLYAASGSYRGSPLWTSTATHDSGIGFSRRAKTLIHIIDENIDEERSKIVNDLVLTGCVDAVSLIDRPWVPRDAKNATGDSLITDGRVAVVLLNQCEHPARADVQATDLPQVRKTEAAALRPFRTAVLTLRNDFYRGNIFYQGYSGAKLGWSLLRRGKDQTDPAKPRIINYGGEEFQFVTGATAIKSKGAPKEPGHTRPSFQRLGEERSYATKLDFSFNLGYGRYANSDFSTQPLDFTLRGTSDSARVDIKAKITSSWNIGGRVALNSSRHFSNEFNYSYSRSNLHSLFILPGGDEFTEQLEVASQTRQFSYNLLAHLKPNGARFRPYLAAGPLVQLYRITESKPATNRILSLAIKDLGLIIGAYQLGSKPPLEGGGIFHFGVEYGGGFKFQVTPHFFTRLDFREALTPQPDFWTKSYDTFDSLLSSDAVQVTFGKLEKHAPLRRQSLTIGVGVSF